MLFLLLVLMTAAPINVLAAEQVTLQLKWLHQFQFAGYYAALEKGFFAEEGLDVILKERDLNEDNILQVLEGDADYGVADSILFLFRDRGMDLVLVAPIFQHSPNVLMTLASSDIRSPRDLVGRRLAFYDNDTEGVGILAMLAKHGVLRDGLMRYSLNERMAKLLAGEVDAVTAYSTNEPFIFREAGHGIRIIDPRHYGIDYYGDILFTHRQEAEQYPQRVEAMRRAVIRGWHYALDNKEEIVDLILEQYNTQGKSRAALMNEAYGLEPKIARHTIEMGYLDTGRLEYILDQMESLDLIASNDQGVQGLVFESGQNSGSRRLNLTESQEAFLSQHQRLRVAVDPDWPPFEYYDAEQRLQGISADYLRLLEERLGIEVELVRGLTWPEVVKAIANKEIDLLPAVSSTPERRQFLNFTQPYVRSPMVIVTDHEVDFIADMNQLRGEKVLVVEGYASDEMLSTHFPDLDITRVTTSIEGLRQVAAGNAYGFVGNLAAATHLIRSDGLANLKVSGQAPYSFDLGMAVRDDWPELVQILDKFLASVSQQEHAAIYSHWVELPVEQGFPWRSVLPGLTLLLLVLIILGLYTLHLANLNRKIRQANSRLFQAEAELRKKNEELEEVSITDKLTGSYNRHHLDRVLNEQAELVRRHQRSLSVVLFDLDFFKAVNDQHGHQLGDEILKKFAVLVKSKTRSSDIFGRWGGEEFLLICPETNSQQACLVAEKIRMALESYEFPAGIQQRLSAGVMSLQAGMTIHQLLSGADYQLYRAKEAGRNQVCCDQPPSLEIS
ncbi:transporter substrate-binding domain-containing diguanylate cyclase [Marinospirillum celere]|nr:transporter substrate-binding domain-containing protein [Marinospirillum celere]